MDIQILRRVRYQQVDYVDGLYTTALGNALPDSVAGELVGIGVAIRLGQSSRTGILNDLLTAAQNQNQKIKAVAGVGNGNLYDENGGELVLSSDTGSKVSASLSASSKYIDVTQRFYVGQDNSATYDAQRRLYQSDNRDELIIRNPISNTVTMQIGLKDSDNAADSNGSFATSFTIAPGRQRRITHDRRQVFIKQNQSGVVSNQYVIVTERNAI